MKEDARKAMPKVQKQGWNVLDNPNIRTNASM